MMTDDEILEVVTAHKEGKKIQARVLPSSRYYSPSIDFQWNYVGSPDWNFNDQEFRVAPEPRKPREWWVHVSESGERIESAMWGVPMCEKCVRVREVIE